MTGEARRLTPSLHYFFGHRPVRAIHLRALGIQVQRVVLEPEAALALCDAGRPYLALKDACDPRKIRDLADPILDA